MQRPAICTPSSLRNRASVADSQSTLTSYLFTSSLLHKKQSFHNFAEFLKLIKTDFINTWLTLIIVCPTLGKKHCAKILVH